VVSRKDFAMQPGSHARSGLTTSILASILAPLPLLILPTPPAAALDFDFAWGNPKPQGNGLYALAFEDALVGYAVGNLGATLATSDGGVTWSVLSRAEFQSDLRDVIVLGPGSLLAAGESPGLFRSTDAGTSWEAIPNPSTATLVHLARISDQVLVATGSEGQVLRSTDAGATWQARTGLGAGVVRDQFWWDEMNGFVVGDLFARRTTDGGLTWQPLPGIPDGSGSPIFTDVTFSDPLNGWVIEHFTTFRTTDGGASWFDLPGPFNRPIYQEETLVLGPAHRFVITFVEGAEIWETTTDGLSWTLRYQRSFTAGYTDLQRLADGTLHVASSFGDLLRSTDGGLTWVNAVTSPGDAERTTMGALDLLPGGRGFAGGAGGVWLETLDNGAHWHAAPGPSQIDTPSSIVFRSELLGLAGGYGPIGQSKVARTTDGGATWTLHALSSNYRGYPVQIAFPSDEIAFTATHGGQGINGVFRSTDGGQTWAARDQGVSGARLQCIFFVDPSTGFVGGGEFGVAALSKTTDSGATWTQVPTAGLFQDPIMDMYWSDANTGVAGGFDGICRTTNGGQTWSQVLSGAVSKIDFRDPLHGFASSYFQPWIWATIDGGLTWELVPSAWEGAPYAIATTSSGFAVTGRGSTILTATERATTAVPPESGSPPLSADGAVRIWPNPSSGRTPGPLTFGIVNPIAGPVELRIYDAAGRLAAALSTRAGAGATAIPWRAPALASGVYLVTARQPQGAQAHGRMVVLP
jgi:photosystem II stability/assembly factor-like uncharacterized protein